MASKQAFKRLTKEYKQIQENPSPFIVARPSEANILEWHYIISGPPGTPYEDGQYHGIIMFPTEYPFRPPSIKMLTPSGRFQTNTRICLSMSDFHEDLWNPSWSVATIINGLLSFMTGSEQTTGSISTSDNTKKILAKKSKEFNISSSNLKFRAIFPDYVEKNNKEIKEREMKLKLEQDAENLKKLELQKAQELKEIPTSIDNIDDPEDKIRAQLIQEKNSVELQQQQNNKKLNDNGVVGGAGGAGGAIKSYFMYLIVFVAIVVGMSGKLMNKSD